MPEDSGQEKTQEPTPKKIEDAKEKGNFARSKEITTVAIFFMALLFFGLGQEYLITRMQYAGAYFFQFDRFLELTPWTLRGLFWKVLTVSVPILAPLFFLIFVAGLAGEIGQIGFRVLKDPFEPKWNKLNPVEGFKRIFSLKQFVEGLKSSIKLAIFALMAVVTVRQYFPQIAVMADNTPMQGLLIMFKMALTLGIRVCIVLAFFALFDYIFQRWQWRQKLRMTHQEVKDEYKQQEGDPILKQRIRSIQMEIARKRMMQEVPDADVVITNPTHYSVALRYNPEDNHAPIVVAKGQNFLAFKIRELAEKEGVPIVENPPLCRAIYKQVEVGRPIPGALFKSVAQILASIWKLAEKRGRRWAATPVRQTA